MSFALPLFLILMIPLAAAVWVLTKGGMATAGRLPGAWNALVAPPLKRFLAGRAGASRNRTPLLALCIAGLIVLALARPGGEVGGEIDLTGLAGRVIVMDASTDISRQAVFIRELENANPTLPTAIIAAGADAYLITPFTTDPEQAHRYLNVLTPDMLPDEGRRLHLGLAMAETALARAGYPAGQIILTSDQPPPAPVPISDSDTIRTIAALGGGDWQAFADFYGAEVIGGGAGATASDDLLARVRDQVAATLPGARFDLSPWLIAAAMLGWLALFRRRAS